MIKQMADMQDGEYGIVVDPVDSKYLNRLVHCFRKKIITIGQNAANVWDVVEGNTNEVEILSLDQLADIVYFMQHKYGISKPLGGS